MPKWPTKSLGELCQLINGRAFKPSDWGKEGLRIVRIQNLNDQQKTFNCFSGRYNDKHYIDDGEILLSWSGTPGTSFGCFRWRRGPALLNQHIFKVITKNGIDGDFFIYAVNSKLDEMIRQAHGGVGLRHITKGKLEAIRLPVPSTDEQRRIVNQINKCLTRVGEIEDLRSQSVPDTKLLLRSYYHDLYVDLLQDHSSFPLKDAGSTFGGGTPSKSRAAFWSGHIPWVSPKDMKHRQILGASSQITDDAVAHSSTRLIERPSVLFVVRGMILAHTLPVAVNRVAVTMNQDMKAITPREGLDVDFLATMLRGAERAILSRCEVAGHGTRRLRTEIWQSIRIPSLDRKEQTAVIDQARAMERLADELNDKVSGEEVGLLRRSILRKAFAGEL